MVTGVVCVCVCVRCEKLPNRDCENGGFFKGKRLGLLSAQDKIAALHMLIRCVYQDVGSRASMQAQVTHANPAFPGPSLAR